MGKSILVMETPKACSNCKLCKVLDRWECACCTLRRDLKEQNLYREIDVVYYQEKPDWCPLREMPERADHPDYCDNGRYDKGWNDCLGTILGSGDRKDSDVQAEKDCENCICSSCFHKSECCEDCEGAIRDCEDHNAPYT